MQAIQTRVTIIHSMPPAREIQARYILTKSRIADYCVNCYVGCGHGCVYCYARFMKRFTGHEEPWGKFLDVKVNAPDVLRREVKHKKPGRVFVSSVCDAYQPAEMRYRLTRACVQILVEKGFYVGVLTKSKLVMRDFDILHSCESCELGLTLTTMDENLRFRIEPGASPTWERIATLEKACNKGIKAWAFLGPFMPYLSDTDEALDALISAVAPLPLCRIYADKLNPLPGFWNSIASFLKRYRPDLLGNYLKLFFDRKEYASYCADLGRRFQAIAAARGVAEKINKSF